MSDHEPDTCRPVEIDGELIRVRGAAEMSDESRAALAEVIGAAKRKFAAEHPAEAAVQRVSALYEQWVKAGPPPLGASIARWWDARLIELRTALTEPKEPCGDPAHVGYATTGECVHGPAKS